MANWVTEGMKARGMTDVDVAKAIGATHIDMVHYAMAGKPIHENFATELMLLFGATTEQRNQIISPQALARIRAGKKPKRTVKPWAGEGMCVWASRGRLYDQR